MSKQKTLLFNSLISILGVITLLLTFQFDKIFVKNNTYAAEVVNYDNFQFEDSKDGETSKISTYNLYSNEGCLLPYFTSKVDDYSGISGDNACADGNNIYYYRYKSASNSSNRNGSVYSTLTFPDSWVQAGKNGYLTVSINAKFGSGAYPYNIAVDYNDRPDKVTMSFAGQNRFLEPSTKKVSSLFETKELPYYLGEYEQGYELNETITTQLVEKTYDLIFRVERLSTFNDLTKNDNWVTGMFVKEPTISFITNDVTAPTIGQMNVENENIFTQSKMVTFDITDEQSGIDKVLINGVEASSVRYVDSNTKKQGTVSFVVNENDKDYKIEVFDNVGNIQTYTYHSSNIDITAPSLTLDFDDNTIFENMRVRFNVTIDTTYTQAEESYFYTFDGSDPKTSSTRITLVNGLNSFEVPAENSYVLKVYACDSAGNETVIERNFSVALKYYNYTINATLNGNNAQNIEISSGQQVLSDTDITCSTADIIKDGVTYKFYKAFINGQASVINNDTFVLKQDTTVDLVYREFVNFEFTKQNYDATGEVLEIEYLANCPKDLVILDITKDGKESAFSTAGTYLVKYSIDNENFVGGGEIELNILNPLTITINSTEYVYNENGFTFDYILSKNSVANELVFINELGETISKEEAQENSLDAGEYQYKFTVLDENYYIVGTTFGNRILSGVFSIQNKNIDLPIYSQTIEYNAQDFVFENTYGYNVDVVFKQNSSVVTPKNAGEYQVEIVINQKNYVGSTSGTLVISKKVLNISANAQSSVYGDKFNELTFEVTGFAGDEYFAFEITGNMQNQAGVYDITFVQPGIEANPILKNYELNFKNAEYTVSKRSAVVSIKSGQSKQYSEDDPIKFEYITSNVLQGDELGLNLTREQGEDVGNYAVKLVSWDNNNYDVQFLGDNFKITARKLILTADSQTKIFGENEKPLTYSVLYDSVMDKDLINLDVQLVRAQGENVGKYEISMVPNANKNYEIVFMNDYLYITPADIEITAISTSKQYGDKDPELKFLVNGEENSTVEFSGNLVREQGENVGTYQILLGSLFNKNYNIIFKSATFNIVIADLIISADNISKVYGEIDPELTWTTDKNIDISQISGNLIRAQGENVGTYEITGEFESPNYNITFVAGEFDILPKTAFINLANQSKTYGSNDPIFKFDISNVLDADIENVRNSIVVSREQGENVGEYKLSATSTNQNYNFIVVEAIFKINKANVKLNINDEIYTYDGTAKMPTATLDIEGDISYKITLNGESVEQAVNAGTYKVEATFAGDENHLNAVATATFTINKADVEVIIYKDIFVMKKDSSIQEPTISCELPSTEYQIVFDELDAGSVGTHAYTIKFKNSNYNSIRGTVQILPIPSNSTNGGSVEFVEGSVDNEDVDLSIEKTEDAENAQNATDMVVDSTYEIKYNQSGNAQVKVELDYNAEDYTNVFVYVYNDKGEAKLLPYQVIDGKIVFSIDADNVKLAIVRQVAGISIVTIGAFVVLFGLIAVSVIRSRKRKKIKHLLRVS